MPLSPTAARTRREIVTAAIRCWGEDTSASLGAIARRAGVGRTTVHRYFPDRPALVVAVDEVCRQRMARATRAARMQEGTGLAALLRLCLAVLEEEELLGLIFSDNPVIDPDRWTGDGSDREGGEGWEDGRRRDEGDAGGLAAVVARGHRDGSLATSLPADWIESALWSTLFACHLTRRAGRSRHEVGELALHTLAHGFGPA